MVCSMPVSNVLILGKLRVAYSCSSYLVVSGATMVPQLSPLPLLKNCTYELNSSYLLTSPSSFDGHDQWHHVS